MNILYLIYVVYIVSSLVLPRSHYYYHLSLKEAHETHIPEEAHVRYITTLLHLETINIALMVCLEATANRESQKRKHRDHGTT